MRCIMFVIEDRLEGRIVSNTKSYWQWFALGGLVLVAAAVVALSPDAWAADAPLHSGGVARVIVQSGRLSVDVREARLAEVLEAIGRQAGAKVVLHGDLSTAVSL